MRGAIRSRTGSSFAGSVMSVRWWELRRPAKMRCGPHDLPAAGGDDEIGDLHEFGDGFAARIFKHLNEVFGGSDLAQAGAHHVDGLGRAYQRAGTGVEDDGVAAFEDAYGLAAARGGGVRRREDGADHAHGLGVFGDAGLFIAFDEAHALGALDVVQHAADLARVRDYLTMDVAVAGFFHSHLGELGDISSISSCVYSLTIACALRASSICSLTVFMKSSVVCRVAFVAMVGGNMP